jgi:hypothetical protein
MLFVASHLMLQDVDVVVAVMQCVDLLQQSGIHLFGGFHLSDTTRNHCSDLPEGLLHVPRRIAFNGSNIILKAFLEFGDANPKCTEHRA